MRVRIIALVIFLQAVQMCSASAKETSKAEDVSACQLLEDPTPFVGKLIRVRAIYSYFFEIQVLKSPNCCPKRPVKVWVEISNDLDRHSERLANSFPKAGDVLGTFTGTLEGGNAY